MCIDTDEYNLCYTVRDNLPVIPLRWFKDGRVFCRVERRFIGGADVTWGIFKVSEIKDVPESLTRLIGPSPVHIELPQPSFSKDLEDLGIF